MISSHHLNKAIEQEQRIQRAAAGFRVELHRESGHVLVIQALAGAVVAIDEAKHGIGGQGIRIHRITVVLAGHVAAASNQILGGLIRAAMTVLQLAGLRTL